MLASAFVPHPVRRPTARRRHGAPSTRPPPEPSPLPTLSAVARTDAPPDGLAAAASARAALSPLTLCAALLDADDLARGAQRLAAALAHQGGFARVTLGLWQDGRVRLVASSPVEAGHAPAELRQCLQGAMEEAIEQGLTLAAPAASADNNAIAVEQQLLHAQVGGALATVPLGRPGAPFAAVCVERHGGAPALSAAELRQLELGLVLAAPALRWLHAASEPWTTRAQARSAAPLGGVAPARAARTAACACRRVARRGVRCAAAARRQRRWPRAYRRRRAACALGTDRRFCQNRACAAGRSCPGRRAAGRSARSRPASRARALEQPARAARKRLRRRDGALRPRRRGDEHGARRRSAGAVVAGR